MMVAWIIAVANGDRGQSTQVMYLTVESVAEFAKRLEYRQ